MIKIPVDPKLATALLKQMVPEYEEFISDLESDRDAFINIAKFAKEAGLDGYPQLYLDKQNILKLLLATLMPIEQVNKLNEEVKLLNQEELTAFTNQTIQNLIQTPENLDSLLDPLIPDGSNPSQLTDQAKIAFTAFLLFSHDLVSFLVHGRRITDLIQSAIKGDDEALCLAVQTDRSVLTLPYFRERLLKSLDMRTDEDAKFIYNLSYRMQNPVMKGKIKNRSVWIALLLLDSLNLLDGSLTRTELLTMFDDAGIEGVASEDNLSRMLRSFRTYQNKR